MNGTRGTRYVVHGETPKMEGRLFEVTYTFKSGYGKTYVVATTFSEAVDKVKIQLKKQGFEIKFKGGSAEEIKVSGYKINLEKIVE